MLGFDALSIFAPGLVKVRTSTKCPISGTDPPRNLHAGVDTSPASNEHAIKLIEIAVHLKCP